MTEQRRGLGRGLAALIPTGGEPDSAADGHVTAQPSDVPGAQLVEVPVQAIRPNPRQPRHVMDEETLAELAASIREVGLLQPVVVRRTGEGAYQLIMGERRWRAASEAGLDQVPAIVRATSDDEMLREALLENLHRVQLNPLEEAAAYQQLLDDFSSTHDELAQRVGRSRSQITNTLRLLRLSAPVQRRVAAGVISAGHARALLSVEDGDAQERLAGRIVAEGLSVRNVEEMVTLGAQDAGDTKPPRQEQQPKVVAPGVHDLAERLSDVFDTRVRVDLGTRKGKIVVEFASVEDLERIVALMAPGLDQR